MVASLLDRLIDRDDERRSIAATVREGLRRDVEAMLNSRRWITSWPRELEELDRSLVNYGLDDLVNESIASSDFRDRFVEQVELLIRRLEPRISRCEVTVLSNRDELDRTLRFRISGLVVIDGDRQELMFDSHVDPVRSCLVMRG